MAISETPRVRHGVDAEAADGPGRTKRIGYRRLPSDQRRDEIIEAAIVTFSENNDASLGDVAATAGISRTSVYRFFETRQELLAAAFRAAGDQLLDYVRDAPMGPPSQALGIRLHRFFDYIEDHETTFIGIVRWTSPLANDEIREIADAVRGELCRMTYDVLEVDEPTPMLELTVRAWVAGVESVALEWLETRGDISRQVVETLLSMHLGSTLLNAAALDPVVADRIEWWLEREPADGAMGYFLRALAGMFTLKITANVARLLAYSEPPSEG
ncbi:TetR/AcrR family transcriptional regulator [Thermomonospora umbrina]|uniref:TetR family transcriptional regulator n=1 Tax=Thermomonospora umbrina TaxID=111806 RepID=A0A3D9SXQ3_9ACTN|nr:TetR/AcrR family transcriptional regulator [Thermomonospora umbrina]REE97785.1 TetR family transcriptional regulator [Thermomonospora umbrina]